MSVPKIRRLATAVRSAATGCAICSAALLSACGGGSDDPATDGGGTGTKVDQTWTQSPAAAPADDEPTPNGRYAE